MRKVGRKFAAAKDDAIAGTKKQLNSRRDTVTVTLVGHRSGHRRKESEVRISHAAATELRLQDMWDAFLMPDIASFSFGLVPQYPAFKTFWVLINLVVIF